MQLRTAHTADLDAATLDAARALLFAAFDDMTEDDWEHCLGGIHAVAEHGGEVIGHAAVVMRRLFHQGRALRCGYVEGVAVRPDRQRRGIGQHLMAAIERYVDVAYDLGALGTTEAALPLYERRGWQVWPGDLYALTPRGIERTADEEGWVLVLPNDRAPLDPSGALTCDWRDGDVW